MPVKASIFVPTESKHTGVRRSQHINKFLVRWEHNLVSDLVNGIFMTHLNNNLNIFSDNS